MLEKKKFKLVFHLAVIQMQREEVEHLILTFLQVPLFFFAKLYRANIFHLNFLVGNSGNQEMKNLVIW